MTGNKANMLNYKKVRNGPLIRFVVGDSHPTIGMGDVQIGNKLVQGVLFVQDLEYNLFSMSQFTDKGYTVKIKSNECKLIDDESKQVMLIAKRKGNLYVIDRTTAQTASLETGWLWHKHLSHLNFKTLNKLSTKKLVVRLPSMIFIKNGLCSACQLGKQAKTSFKSKVRHSSTRPLQLLHMDLFESSVVSYVGKKYGLVVVDDYSRFTWAIFLKHKSETRIEIPSLLNKLEVMKNDKVSVIRTDHGTEFVNQYIKEFCTCKGIQHQLSSVRTPQ